MSKIWNIAFWLIFIFLIFEAICVLLTLASTIGNIIGFLLLISAIYITYTTKFFINIKNIFKND